MTTHLPPSPSRRRRSICALASVTAIGLLVAACGAQSATSTTGKTKAAASKQPSGTLEMLVSSAPGSNAGFRAVNAAFEKKYPKVTIDFSSIPNADFATAQSTRETARDVDLTVAGTQDLPSYVNPDAASTNTKAALAGDYVNLNNQSFEKRLTPAVLAATSLKGKHYDFPLGFSYYTGVFYNKQIFAKHHLSIPKTWAQFVKLATTLRRDGVAPLGMSGIGGNPQLPMLAAVQGLYPTYQDKVNLNKGLWKKTAKFTNPKLVEVLDRTKTIWSFGESNWAGVPWASVFSEFGNGKFAMMPDGTWDTDALAAASPSLKFGYFPIPTSNVAADNATLGGKVDLSLSIPSNSKNVSAALAYINFMSQPKNYELFGNDSGFSPAENGIKLTGFLKSIEPYTQPFSPAWDTVWDPNPTAGVNAATFNYAGLAPVGKDSTAKQAAADGETAWAAGL